MLRPLWHLARLWLAVAAAYLLGSILSADLASRLAGRGRPERIDIRTAGSGNPGAANAAGQLGYAWAAGVLAGDMLKGALAALAGRRLAGGTGAYLAGAAAVAGHCYPAWSGGRGGGKGVATSAGTTWVNFPAYVPIDLAMIAVTYLFSRHAAAATIVTSAAFALAAGHWHAHRWPNAWGPRATIWLPVYAAVTASLITIRFLTPVRTPPPSEI